ncbi:hypothetical protein ACPVPU_14335 [Sphingomonas sp. CJ99]
MDRIGKGVTIAGAIAAALALASASPAAAQGQQAAALDRCLSAKTTRADRTAMVRWTFAVAALSPDLADLAQVTPAKREAATQAAAVVFNRLAFTDCKTEMTAAARTGGQAALQQGFSRIAQLALQERLSDPQVAGGLMALVARLDLGALAAMMLEAGQNPFGGMGN